MVVLFVCSTHHRVYIALFIPRFLLILFRNLDCIEQDVWKFHRLSHITPYIPLFTLNRVSKREDCLIYKHPLNYILFIYINYYFLYKCSFYTAFTHPMCVYNLSLFNFLGSSFVSTLFLVRDYWTFFFINRAIKVFCCCLPF